MISPIGLRVNPGMSFPNLRIGCAGWNIPTAYRAQFPSEGSHLVRYTARFPAVEINSSFYRPHQSPTYQRWAASVPKDFQFSVKVPKQITHVKRLKDCDIEMTQFLSECTSLGENLGPLLVQLPPSLRFDRNITDAFFAALREQFSGLIACEPRHETWFAEEVDLYLREFQMARVAADPAIVTQAFEPGGWHGFAYYRLHGSPKIYYDAYEPSFLDAMSQKIAALTERGPVWCIFDNTAMGAATSDAMTTLAQADRLLHEPIISDRSVDLLPIDS